MKTKDYREVRLRAQKFTENNFVQLCRDILERRESIAKGVYLAPKGKFGELVSICAEIPQKGASMVAEGFVERQAIIRGSRAETDFSS